MGTFCDRSPAFVPDPTLPPASLIPASALAAAVRGMSVGVVVHDMAGGILSANPAAVSVLGLTVEMMQGRHPVDPRWRLMRGDGVTPLPPEEIPSEITRRTLQPCQNVELALLKDGRTKTWLVVNTDVFHDETGAPAGVVATFQDVSAAHVREAETTALLARLTNAVPGAIYELLMDGSPAGRFLYVSPRTEAVLGISVASALRDANTFWDRVHADDIAGLRRNIDDVMQSLRAEEATLGREHIIHEFRFQREDGEWRWLEARARGTVVADGVLFHGFTSDISERRKFEEQMRAARSEEIIGQLAAGLAHNFNNLLAAILPNLEIIRNEVPDRVRAEVEDAHRAATNAADLMRQLMLLVRHETPSQGETVDVGHVVHQVVRICRRTFDRRIRIVEELPPDGLVVRGARSSLEQVLLNLCLNARDAMDAAADPQLRVRLRLTADRTAAVIEVEDTGTGMTPEVVRRLGEPFFTTKPVGKGTGLGLASAYGIVREIGGRIGIESSPGVGTTFTVVLPLVDAPTPAIPAPAAVDVAKPTEERRCKVLVVDDEMMVRATAGRLLSRLGCEAVLAIDGASGLRAFDEHPEISLAIVDLSMPGMSGIEVLNRLKQQRPNLPVVISSGYIADKREVASADAILPKPFDSTALAGVITTLLPKKAAQPL